MVSALRRRRAGQGGAAILAGSPGRRWPREFAAGSSGTTDGGRPEGDCSSLCDDDGAGRGRRRSGLWLSVRVDSRRHADRRWIHERRLRSIFICACRQTGRFNRTRYDCSLRTGYGHNHTAQHSRTEGLHDSDLRSTPRCVRNGPTVARGALGR